MVTRTLCVTTYVGTLPGTVERFDALMGRLAEKGVLVLPSTSWGVPVGAFQAVAGGEKTLADVPDGAFHDASELTDSMGAQAVAMCATRAKASGG